MATIHLADYDLAMKFPKTSGKQTIFRLITDTQRKVLIRAIFPDADYAFHQQMARAAQADVKKLRADKKKELDRAFVAKIGRKPNMFDYKISGIWRDDWPAATAQKLRNMTTAVQEMECILYAHNAMLRKADKINED